MDQLCEHMFGIYRMVEMGMRNGTNEAAKLCQCWNMNYAETIILEGILYIVQPVSGKIDKRNGVSLSFFDHNNRKCGEQLLGLLPHKKKKTLIPVWVLLLMQTPLGIGDNLNFLTMLIFAMRFFLGIWFTFFSFFDFRFSFLFWIIPLRAQRYSTNKITADEWEMSENYN